MPLPLRLPYYAENAPCLLPSRADIQAAPCISNHSGQRVAKVDDHFVVKYGTQVSLLEGENMIFVKQVTNLAVPEVYAIYRDIKEECNYIVIEYIRGKTLASMWSSLDNAKKVAIARILRGFITELRTIPSPHYFGSIGKRHLLESMFWTPECSAAISGPFDTETQLNEAMTRKYARFGGSAFKADFYRRALPEVLSGHTAVFTHADFQRKNIMVDIISDDDIRVTLIDWEKSGWLPSYWEYAMAMISDRFKDDWSEWVEKIMEPFYGEYSYLKMLQVELWS